MKRILGFGLLAMSLMAYASAANAQWYFSGNAGVTSLEDASVTDTFTGGNITGEVEFDNGFGLSGAVGHTWGPIRLEGELSYRQNDLDQIDVQTLNIAGVVFTGLGTASLGGDTSSFGFMANGYYDFNPGGNWVPFVMAGIGGANLNIDITSVAGAAVTYDESDTVLAYQVGAGLGYNIQPGTMVTLSYRFFGTSDPTFDDGVDKIESEYQSHNIWAGINVQF
ncbi:MAG: outer membrane beta-barrel protein [Rhodospirillales bacterium]